MGIVRNTNGKILNSNIKSELCGDDIWRAIEIIAPFIQNHTYVVASKSKKARSLELKLVDIQISGYHESSLD